MKKKQIPLLVFIFIFAFCLRILFLQKLSLTFGYDQARDAIISQQILAGDWKILGPPASIPGLYHGVFYYYLLAPAYFFGHGSPLSAAYWIALLNAAAVFIVFYLGYRMTNKIWVGILASFLFALSFEATQYATWLSNPTIGVWTVPLMYLGLWLWINSENKFAPVITALGLGFSIQSEIFLIYHAIPLVLWLWLSRKNVNKKQIIIFMITLLMTLGSMFLSEIKFGFRSIGGLISLAGGSEANLAYAKSIGDYLILYLNQIGRIFSFNSFPGNIGWGGGFVIVLALYSLIKRDKIGTFLATWLFSHITVVKVGGVTTPFLMVGIGPAVSLIIAYYLAKWWQLKYFLIVIGILIIIISGNLIFIFRENPKGSTLFAIQKDMLLSKQLSLIDFSYQEAKGKEFSINSLTSPLWINIVWTYLYKWYGLPKYKYLPSWHGRDQVGQLDSLPKDTDKINNYFLILEPMGGIPSQYLDQTLDEENVVSKIISEKNYGELRIQKRERVK